MTRLETGTVVAILMEQYGVEVTPMLVAVWHGALGGYDFADVQRAAIEVLMSYTGTFAPTVGMVATALRKQRGTQESELSEGEAYQILQDAIKRWGRYNQASAMHDISSKSTLVERAVRVMGWSEICSWRLEDEPANRAHFWRVLAGLRQTSDRKMLLEPTFTTAEVAAEVLKRIGYGDK